ncbi:MAG: glutamine--fructose-6-phosphate transaminase (isomerizing) [Gammaproteobacteria bacterium]|nr:glutamine--fructose-6-phosphate transaminase (isomerizing) [Gammaproteobacteria bacterium]
MCGIVGAIAKRDVQDILVEGLKRLEYRGYDSAGVALLTNQQTVERRRAVGKVAELEAVIEATPVAGNVGIAHTRWATHGEPAERNAHPHMSGKDLAIVHNGIIENHQPLREELEKEGYFFESDTDTEVIVHLIAKLRSEGRDLFQAVMEALDHLDGAYALGVIAADEPDRLIAARSGSPLVVGVGIGENFIASDSTPLLPVTNRFIYLEEGDVAEVRRDGVDIYDRAGHPHKRPVVESTLKASATDKGEFRHYMMKEIYEQPVALRATLAGRLEPDHVAEDLLGAGADGLFKQVKGVHIISCGTSYHAGLIARYWIEQLARVPCVVEIASEYRYRQPVVLDGRLFVSISQSGETADTLAALRMAKGLGYVGSVTVCNVPDSSLVRESDHALMTHAGPEIGVASTKAFTTQLSALLVLATALQKALHGEPNEDVVAQLRQVASVVEQCMELDAPIKQLAEKFADKHHALFLGRGPLYPVAMEGALKLKEISYIHAEAYAAGELKHGPLALVDEDMPVVAVAPNNELLEKLKSNLEEVRARGGELIVFADAKAGMTSSERVTVIPVPHADEFMEPIVYTVPLQLLSYHVAVLKGTDVDQPRNLAKSVTVE